MDLPLNISIVGMRNLAKFMEGLDKLERDTGIVTVTPISIAVASEEEVIGRLVRRQDDHLYYEPAQAG